MVGIQAFLPLYNMGRRAAAHAFPHCIPRLTHSGLHSLFDAVFLVIRETIPAPTAESARVQSRSQQSHQSHTLE